MAHIGGETNVVLLGWTQQYLRSLVEQETPDSMLAAAWDEFYRVYDGLMRRFAITAIATGLLVGGCLTGALRAADTKATPPPPALKVGDVAPDFKLQYFDGTGLKDVSLSEYRGKKNVVLAFYIFAFTGG